jgi:hypothetical protein
VAVSFTLRRKQVRQVNHIGCSFGGFLADCTFLSR